MLFNCYFCKCYFIEKYWLLDFDMILLPFSILEYNLELKTNRWDARRYYITPILWIPLRTATGRKETFVGDINGKDK